MLKRGLIAISKMVGWGFSNPNFKSRLDFRTHVAQHRKAIALLEGCCSHSKNDDQRPARYVSYIFLF
jgi:hypothetical protein